MSGTSFMCYSLSFKKTWTHLMLSSGVFTILWMNSEYYQPFLFEFGARNYRQILDTNVIFFHVAGGNLWAWLRYFVIVISHGRRLTTNFGTFAFLKKSSAFYNLSYSLLVQGFYVTWLAEGSAFPVFHCWFAVNWKDSHGLALLKLMVINLMWNMWFDPAVDPFKYPQWAVAYCGTTSKLKAPPAKGVNLRYWLMERYRRLVWARSVRERSIFRQI